MKAIDSFCNWYCCVACCSGSFWWCYSV